MTANVCYRLFLNIIASRSFSCGWRNLILIMLKLCLDLSCVLGSITITCYSLCAQA